MVSMNIILEPQLVAVSRDARYLTRDELFQSATMEAFELKDVVQIIHDEIEAALKLLPLPKPDVLVQFISNRNVSNEYSSTNVNNVTFTDVGETSSYLKQGRKRKRGLDDSAMVLVTVTYGEEIQTFRFPISLGQLKLERKVLLKLKNEVAKRFKLMPLMNCLKLKYTDEDDDIILIGVDKDLELAMVASGSENCMNLICKLSAY